MKALQDRVALVTGASSGFGRAIAERLAAEGATVALVARRRPALEEVARGIEGQGGHALVLPADVTKEAEVVGLFAKAKQALGRVDIAVNNAGTAIGVPTNELSFEKWRELMEVNLDAVFLCSREAFKIMKAQGGGRIINMGSISALGPRKNSIAYSTSKFAVEGLTRSLALDGREFGIAASVIHPGAAATGFTKGRVPGPGKTPDDYLMSPDDVARVALLMCTLPPEVNLFEATILPNRQPSFLGRG
jgi:NAD(P)-dependent dehydrogenase (short-subunit alcohol dehydrogenase family)